MSTSSAEHVVAIGTSAGGVTALQVVIGALPRDFGAAVLVVQHVEARRISLLPQILARHVDIGVHAAVDGEAIMPGHVYVAVANLHLLARGDRVAFSSASPVRFCRPSVDALFHSVATSYGVRAIAVVLTGSGRDGSDGIREVKRQGGTTIVQDTAEAKFSSMPASARATGCVDRMLPLTEIAPALVRLVGTGPDSPRKVTHVGR